MGEHMETRGSALPCSKSPIPAGISQHRAALTTIGDPTAARGVQHHSLTLPSFLPQGISPFPARDARLFAIPLSKGNQDR